MSSKGRAGFEGLEDDGGSLIILAWLRLASCEADDVSCMTVRSFLRLALLSVRRFVPGTFLRCLVEDFISHGSR